MNDKQNISPVVKNINDFISFHKVKQKFLAFKSGINEAKLSRILTGKQDATLSDIEQIAKGLGRDSFYFQTARVYNTVNHLNDTEIVFSMGTPTQEKIEYANKIFDFLETVDFLLSMEAKIQNNLKRGYVDGYTEI